MSSRFTPLCLLLFRVFYCHISQFTFHFLRDAGIATREECIGCNTRRGRQVAGLSFTFLNCYHLAPSMRRAYLLVRWGSWRSTKSINGSINKKDVFWRRCGSAEGDFGFEIKVIQRGYKTKGNCVHSCNSRTCCCSPIYLSIFNWEVSLR